MCDAARYFWRFFSLTTTAATRRTTAITEGRRYRTNCIYAPCPCMVEHFMDETFAVFTHIFVATTSEFMRVSVCLYIYVCDTTTTIFPIYGCSSNKFVLKHCWIVVVLKMPDSSADKAEMRGQRVWKILPINNSSCSLYIYICVYVCYLRPTKAI